MGNNIILETKFVADISGSFIFRHIKEAIDGVKQRLYVC